jgi:hypothetical protein
MGCKGCAGKIASDVLPKSFDTPSVSRAQPDMLKDSVISCQLSDDMNYEHTKWLVNDFKPVYGKTPRRKFSKSKENQNTAQKDVLEAKSASSPIK